LHCSTSILGTLPSPQFVLGDVMRQLCAFSRRHAALNVSPIIQVELKLSDR